MDYLIKEAIFSAVSISKCVGCEFFKFYFQTTAKEAQRKCKLDAQGADLAIMPTPFHNAFVATMLTNRAWVGITTDTAKGVHFTWIDQRTGLNFVNLFESRTKYQNDGLPFLYHDFKLK